MAEKERMQPFWYQGNLIDPNEELPFPLEQLEAENAWNDMWEALSGDESSEKFKYPCSNGIYFDTSKTISSVRYCGSCGYVDASNTFDPSECSL